MGLVAVVIAGLFLAGCSGKGVAGRTTGRTATADEARPAANRPIYPWSVVAGGLASPVSMRQAMADDPVVRQHYAGLNPDGFRASVLTDKRQGYVSYRIGDKIYWTRRMVTLQAGETVLTDGDILVRGRCGNLFSPTPRVPVAPETIEPPEVAMDAPVAGSLLMEPPKYPAEPAVATEKFANPKELIASAREANGMPAPDSREAMPPAWVTGGASPTGVYVGGARGGDNSPEPTGGTPRAEEKPAPPPTNPLEKPPPMVHVPLEVPPDSPKGPPTFGPPPKGNPPYLPPVYPPLSPPPGPPTSPPPSGPPPVNPPPSDPPSGPPPYTPPPSDPPSNPPPGGNPPPSGPPPLGPPPLDPPPPVTAIPEPGAWILLAIGIAAIAAGSVGRKS